MDSIFDNNEKDAVVKKINEIAAFLYGKDFSENDISLMYGNIGIAIFLFYYWQWTNKEEYYDKASDLIVNAFNSLTKQIQIYRFDSSKVDLTFKSGITGIGWGLNHLIINDIIESDLEETMCQIDPVVYKQMIDGIYSDNQNDMLSALEVCLYSSERKDRFSKEYTRRFVAEWYKRIDKLPFPYVPKNKKMEFPIYVLRKIEEHFPEIEYTKELINFYSPEIEKCFTETDKLTVGSGLEYGLTNLAFRANFKYNETGNQEYKEKAKEFFNRLLDRANYSDSKSGNKFWLTSSKGIYSLNYGLLNGVSGIGLTLLSSVSNDSKYKSFDFINKYLDGHFNVE